MEHFIETALLTHGLQSVTNEEIRDIWRDNKNNIVWIAKGEIIIAGKHMEKMNENQLVAFRRENGGFIFQSYHLFQTLNAI